MNIVEAWVASRDGEVLGVFDSYESARGEITHDDVLLEHFSGSILLDWR